MTTEPPEPQHEPMPEGEEPPPRGARTMAAVRWGIVLAAAALAAFMWLSYARTELSNAQPRGTAPAAKYHCPMHPQIVADAPGECPICHMSLELIGAARSAPVEVVPALLLVSSRKLRSNTMWAFYYWIRDSVKQNKPWDQFARDIFTASGSNRENGALNYFVLHKDPILLSENATQAFLGQRLTCARCHNHPLEKWTQKQYYQLANLFARIGVKNGPEGGESIIFAKTSGDVNHPKLLKPLAPTPLEPRAN